MNEEIFYKSDVIKSSINNYKKVFFSSIPITFTNEYIIGKLLKDAYENNIEYLECLFGEIKGHESRNILLPVENDVIINNNDLVVVNNNVSFYGYVEIENTEFVYKQILKNAATITTPTKPKLYEIQKFHLASGEIIEKNIEDGRTMKYVESSIKPLILFKCKSDNHLRYCLLNVNELSTNYEMNENVADSEHLNRTEIHVEFENIIYIVRIDKIIDTGENIDNVCIKIMIKLPLLNVDLINDDDKLLLNSLAKLENNSNHSLYPIYMELAKQIYYITKKITRITIIDRSYDIFSLYYPNLFGDEFADVRLHYNKKKIASIARSDLKKLRILNNRVKLYLINNFVNFNSNVLDFGCGHGQDLLKYIKKDLKNYIGIDISNAEIKLANKRLEETIVRYGIDEGVYRFYVGNMLDNTSYEKYLIPYVELINNINAKRKVSIPQLIQFDVISIQLSIHYCLNTYQNAEKLISNVTRYLKPGGILICSCPSTDIIGLNICSKLKKGTSRLSNYNEIYDFVYYFGNSIYRVEFGNTIVEKYFILEEININEVFVKSITSEFEQYLMNQSFEDSNSIYYLSTQEFDEIKQSKVLLLLNLLWGIKYNFWLKNHINAEEYVLPWIAFCVLCSKNNLVCKYKKNFIDCELDTFDNKIQQFGKALKKVSIDDLRQSNDQLDQSQLECINFYQLFVFEKNKNVK